jgi:hypothetical protein
MSVLDPRESRNLQELANSVRQYTEGVDGSAPSPTAIQGLRFLRSDQASRPGHCLFKPALYMTLQGAKWATFADKRYKFGAGQGLMVAVDVPSRGTVTVATAKKPYLGLEMELDFAVMQQVAEQLEMTVATSGKPKARGAFVLELSRQLVYCASTQSVFWKLLKPFQPSIRGSCASYATGYSPVPAAIRSDKS